MKYKYVPCDEYYFSRNLKMLRLLQVPYLSQERLSKRLGVSRKTYQKYESGKRMPPAWFALNVANYFRVPMEQLLGEQLNKKGMKKKE